MIRTQMYLDEDIYTDLARVAEQENKSRAEIARDILKEGLAKRKSIDKSGKAVLLAIADLRLAGGADPYLSGNVDHYLYGAPKNEL
jgi:metal-responsive CopG/Arc/MetJ family transcriptional regulator